MLCLSPLVILGLESYFRGGTTTNNVATVGDEVISKDVFQDTINNQRTMLIQNGVESSLINQAALNSEVLENLINRALLIKQTKHLGMYVSDAIITTILRNDPQYFDENGQFSNERFELSLRRQGITKEQLFELKRQELNINSLLNNIVYTELYSNAAVNELIAVQNKTRPVWVYRLPWQQYQNNVLVTDSEVKNYYNENKHNLNSKAMVDLNYIMIDPEAIKVGDVTEEDVVAQYNAFKANYVNVGRQKISQILITGANAESKIKDVQARLKKGESFETLAKQFSEDPVSAKKGGDIGTFNPDLFGNDSEKVAKAIQNLQAGEVSQPVKTSFGYQIFKVQSVEETTLPSMESMRAELTERARNEKHEQLIADKITRINEMATDGVSIEDIAAEEKLQVKTLKNYTKVDNQTILNQPVVIEAAFDDFALQDESISTSIAINNKKVWVQPFNYRPVAPLTLAQASNTIKQTLVKQKATEKALKEAQLIASKVNEKGMLAAGVSFTSLGNINRQNRKLTPNESAVAFSQHIVDGQIKAATQVTDKGVSVLVAGALDHNSDKKISELERTQVATFLRNTRGEELFSDYINYLKTATKVTKNDKLLQEVAGF